MIILFLRIPIVLCKILGDTTAQYRWFAIAYLVIMFIFLPVVVMLLSLNKYLFITVMVAHTIISTPCTIVTLMQRNPKAVKYLPSVLQTWDFLPEFMHSLDPYDR